MRANRQLAQSIVCSVGSLRGTSFITRGQVPLSIQRQIITAVENELSTAENYLIDSLPPKDRLRLLARCEPVQLVLTQVLCEHGKPADYAYFPIDAFISLLAKVEKHPEVEVGMIGREGMLGAGLALGVPIAPLRGIVQGAGKAWRIDADAFRNELTGNTALHQGLCRYLFVVINQLATSSACLRFHMIGPRLARWLLMSHDRAHADNFHITHEFLAYMLGVRRVGITMAAGILQHKGLIKYRRGELTILDRSGLEAEACSCYASNQQIYRALMH